MRLFNLFKSLFLKQRVLFGGTGKTVCSRAGRSRIICDVAQWGEKVKIAP